MLRQITKWVVLNVNCFFLVLILERPFSYTIVDMNNINVILNNNDVSEYLKIAPNGLEVRKTMKSITLITFSESWIISSMLSFISNRLVVMQLHLSQSDVHLKWIKVFGFMKYWLLQLVWCKSDGQQKTASFWTM